MSELNIYSLSELKKMPKEEVIRLQCSLKNLCFPKSRSLDVLVQTLEIKTLIELLNIDVEQVKPHYFRGCSLIGAQKILNHILNIGFKMDSYPFLKKIYWEDLKLRIEGKKYTCIKIGSNYSQYGVKKSHAIIFSISGEMIIPFEGTYKQCVAWLVKNTKNIQQ